jgi:phthalate 4,5-cis-dihydrodiol dehydrogenase
MATSVRAKTFDWNPDRAGIGAHVVFIQFADGAVATAVYNGYGGFSTEELAFDVTELGFERASEAAKRPRARARSPDDELHAKRERSRTATWTKAPHQPFFGLTLVSCERGDIRQSKQGLFIYAAEGKREIMLPTDRGPRDMVLAELHDAIREGKPALHDARWGLANLEICDAAIESSASGVEVTLQCQVAR